MSTSNETHDRPATGARMVSLDLKKMLDCLFNEDRNESEDSSAASQLGSISRETLSISSDETAQVQSGAIDQTIPLEVSGYSLVRFLGKGATGNVYKAVRQSDNQVVAIKVLSRTDEPSIINRFRTSAELQFKLDDEAIVRVFEICMTSDPPHVVMEYVDGEPLGAILARKLPSEEQAVEWLMKIAKAIVHAHSRNILHRDLKPSNVILEENGAIKVLDFGMAFDIDAHSERQTREGEMFGTPAYMAPEQIRGEEPSHATDVWGLGALLYEMLTGRPPFNASSVFDILNDVQFSDPIPPSSLNRSISRKLDLICLKALAKLPQQRYQSAEALISDLINFRSGRKISASPPSFLLRARKYARKNPGMAASAIGMLAVVIILLLSNQIIRERNHQVEIAVKQFDSLSTATEALIDGLVPLEFDNVLLWQEKPSFDPEQLKSVLMTVERSLGKMEEGKVSLHVANLKLYIARAYRGLGQYVQAEKVLTEAQLMYRRLNDSKGIANGLLEMGRVMREQGKFKDGEKTLEESLAIQQADPQLASDLALQATTRFYLAWTLSERAGIERNAPLRKKASLIFSEVAKFRKAAYDKAPENESNAIKYGVALSAEALSELGAVNWINAPESILKLTQGLELVANPHVEERSTFKKALTCYFSARIARAAKQWAIADQQYESAVRYLREAVHPDHALLALLIGDQAGCFRDHGDMESAHRSIRSALDIGRRSAAKGHPQMIEAIEKFADDLSQGGPDSRAEAKKLYAEAIQYSLERYGESASWTLRLKSKLQHLADSSPERK